MDNTTDWQPIETAPKDGSKQWVRRTYNGQIICEGWAVWGINSADAPIRKGWEGHKLAEGYPPDNEWADTPRWLTPDRMYSFPTPTEWKPGA